MNSKSHILPILAFSLCAGALFSCSGKRDKADAPTVNPDSLPQQVQPVAKAIINDSPAAFAAIVSYPIQRPYPLKNIEDSATMVKYYDKIVDDSLKNVVKTAHDSLWHEEGWRGWTVGDGSYFYIDNGKIYAVNYLSDVESSMLDSLRTTEISTLEPTLRQGWIPVMCIVDTVSGSIFRIDTDPNVEPPKYRLAGYPSDTDLAGMPALLLYGNLDIEGSMANRYYHFADSVGTTAEYYPDAVEETSPYPEIEVSRKGHVKKYKVKPKYWLDIVSHPESGNP